MHFARGLGARFALEFLLRTRADAVAGVDRPGGGVGAQIGAPDLGAGAGGSAEPLAIGVSAIETAQIAALAGPDAGDEDGHVGRLRGRVRESLPGPWYYGRRGH